jgi:hypothetical protein
MAIHRNPSFLDAKRVHVRGVRVIESRGQLRLAHEALRRGLVVPSRTQHLDNRCASDCRLLAAVHGAVPVGADPLAQHELAQLAT